MFSWVATGVFFVSGLIAAEVSLAQAVPPPGKGATAVAPATDHSGPMLFGLWAGTEQAAALAWTEKKTGVPAAFIKGDENVEFRDATLDGQKCHIVLTFVKGRLYATAAIYLSDSAEPAVKKSLEAKYGPGVPTVKGLDDTNWEVSKPTPTMVSLTHLERNFVVAFFDLGEMGREFQKARNAAMAREAELETAIPANR